MVPDRLEAPAVTLIYCPHTFRHEPTWDVLDALDRSFCVVPVPLQGPNDYLAHLEARWSEGVAFVNIEHDIITTPASIALVAGCKRDWCWHPYEGVTEPQPINLGLTKFSATFIASTPHLWTDFASSSKVKRARWQRQPTWEMLDGWIAPYAQERGIWPHDHWPPVINARPEGVERMRDDSMAGFLHG